MPEALLDPGTVETLVVLAGIGQLLLVVASLAIPRVLRWPEQLATLQPLLRQIFWTYAIYIWLAHLCFGLLSTFAARLLVDGSPLAAWVSSFIAAWWTARLVLQFTVLDRSATPPGAVYKLAEVALVSLFVALAAVYVTVAVVNFTRPR